MRPGIRGRTPLIDSLRHLGCRGGFGGRRAAFGRPELAFPARRGQGGDLLLAWVRG